MEAEMGCYVYKPRNPKDGQQTSRSLGGLEQLLTWSPRREPTQPAPDLGLPASGTQKTFLLFLPLSLCPFVMSPRETDAVCDSDVALRRVQPAFTSCGSENPELQV